MDKKKQPHGWGELVEVLPGLTTIEQRPIQKYGLLSGTSFIDVQKEVAYQQALKSKDPVEALQAVSAPVALHYTDLIAGSWKKHQAKQEFPLADFARGVLESHIYGATAQAERAFIDAEQSVGRFKLKMGVVLPHEEPIAHAAACSRLLLNNQHDAAFSELTQLQKLAKIYPSWQKCTRIQCAMLAGCGYKPALEQLASQGNVDAQIHIVQEACVQAASKKDVEAQISQFKACVPYVETLVQHPDYTALGQALTQYIAAACSYENQHYAQTTQYVIELLELTKDQASLKEVRHVAGCLLDAVALKGHMRARCYKIAQCLQSSDKKERRAGIEHAQILVQDLVNSLVVYDTDRFDEFGIIPALEQMASSNNGTACVVLAQWKCNQVLALANTPENAAKCKALHEIVALYAQLGLKNTKQQPGLLKTIVAYARGVIAVCENNKETAVKQLIAAIDTRNTQNQFDAKIRNKAGTFLIELAKQGDLRARCRYALHRIHQEGKNITQETQQECCMLAQDFLDRAPQELYKQECGAQLVLSLQDCAAAGNPQAQYLASRLLFRVLHVGHEDTGLEIFEQQKLSEVFMQGAKASKAGVKEASLFVKAVMQYRGALGLLEQEKHDAAVAQLCELLDVNLAGLEQKICQAFAKHQLVKLAHAGHSMAGGWHIAQLLVADNKDEMTKGLAVCERVFTGFLTEYDIPRVSAEKWQKALESFKKYAIIQKLQEILHNDVYKELHGGVGYILSSCYMLQAMIPYEFLECQMQDQNRNESLLKTALELASLACAQATSETKDLYREQLGKIYYELGQHYLERNNIPEAVHMLSEGSRLQHPACMRACAMVVLEQSSVDGEKIDKRIFEAQIATIERAYKLGDMAAGAILAEHYFDGDSCRFACGYSLAFDQERALSIACKLGNSYPQTARILGFLEYKRLTQDPQNRGKKINLGPCAKLLMDGAAGRQRKAYEVLRELCLCPWVTQELSQKVIHFLQERRDERVPEAACALGSIVLADKDCRYVEDAITMFKDAIDCSDGVLGHNELAHLYTTFEFNGKKDVLLAADHCISMIKAGARSGGAPIDQGTLTAYILELLQSYEGSAEEKLRAHEKYDAIVAQLKSVGVTLVPHHASGTQETQEQRNRQARGVVDEALAQANAATMEAFRSLGGALIDHLLAQPEALERVRAVADTGNPFAQYVMSNIYVRYGKTGKDVYGKAVDRTKTYIQALRYVEEALAVDTTNEEYSKQFCVAFCQLLHYNRTTLISTLAVRQDVLEGVLAFVDRGLEHCATLKVEEDIAKIKKEALACLKALACKGCVKALEMYISTYLYSSQTEAQKTALEIICSCCNAVHEQGPSAWQESGINVILEKHISHIQSLADSQNNPHAALTLCLWYAAQHENVQGGTQTKEVVDRLYHYCCKAKDGGLKEAIPTWYMFRLTQPEKMSEGECKKALTFLENETSTSIHSAEFLIGLYRDGGVLPCGYIVGIDRARAKKIALRVVSKSRLALLSLAVMAKEAGEHEEFLKYALVLHQSGVHTLDDIIQYCMLHSMYPQSVMEHLEKETQQGNTQASQGIATIKKYREEREKK